MFWINFQQFFKNAFFGKSLYRKRLKRYYCSKILNKLHFWGFLQICMGVFEKTVDRFQNRYTWQNFSCMLSKHSDGKSAHDFSKCFKFYFSPGRTEGFIKVFWLLLKNWYNCLLLRKKLVFYEALSLSTLF